MSDRFKQLSACLLLLALLSVTGLAYPKIVAHSLHHNHHSTDTHRSPVCFWVCTAGQMETSCDSPDFKVLAEIRALDASFPAIEQTGFENPAFPRGPPAL